MFRRRPRNPAEIAAVDEIPTLARKGLPDGGTQVLPSVGLVQQVLDEFGLRHSIDSDGDLIVRWEKCSVYFFFYGDKNEVLQARLYLTRRFDVDDRGSLTILLDEWNRTRLFAKAYTILPDDGKVSVCAEECHDFEGATRAQIKYAVAMWIDILLRFGDWIDEQI